MKKIIALLLAVIMVMGLATVVSAETTDVSTVTVTKEYKLTNEGTTSPAETFTFSGLTCTGITNVGVKADGTAYYTTADAPVPTISSITYTAGEAGGSNKTKTATITLPNYEAVGVYTYTFSEVDGNTAGVTYRKDAIKLVVTVVEQNGKVRVATVHTEGDGATAKSNLFDNTYSAGELKVSKKVTGNMADTEKQFKMTVKFTAPTGDTVRESISYNDGSAKTIEAGWTGEKSVEIEVKDGETVTFSNIPYGVTYEVTEDDYTGEGYDAAQYDTNKTGTIGASSVSTEVTNNKDVTVDTGIVMDSVPFIVMAVIAVIGLAAFTAKKRVQE